MDFSSMRRDHQSGAWQSRGQGAKLHPADWAVESGAVGEILRDLNCQLRRRRHRRLRALTGGAIALIVAGFVWRFVGRPAALNEGRLAPSAVVSRPERQILSDGSIVELKHGAQVAVAFTESVRRVILNRGEAHFQVAKMAKPFVVAVGDVEVRAVGTAFAVQLGDAHVEVLVTEGRVAVGQTARTIAAFPGATTASSDSDPSPANAMLIQAGSRLVVPAAAAAAPHSRPEAVPVETAELAARLAWRMPRLEFSRTPLAEALAMMKQHAAAGKVVTVTLSNPSLGRVQVSGVLRADNMEPLLRLLEEEYDIKPEYLSSNEVVLRKGS